MRVGFLKFSLSTGRSTSIFTRSGGLGIIIGKVVAEELIPLLRYISFSVFNAKNHPFLEIKLHLICADRNMRYFNLSDGRKLCSGCHCTTIGHQDIHSSFTRIL